MKNYFEPISGCPGEEIANYVNLEMMSYKMPVEKLFSCFIRSSSADVVCIIGRAKKRF